MKWRCCLFVFDKQISCCNFWLKFSSSFFCCVCASNSTYINCIGYMYMHLWLHDNTNYHCNLTIKKNRIPTSVDWILWLMEKWCGRDRKREVVTTAGGGGGVCWVSKGKTQPIGNPSWQPPLHHPSGCTGRQPPNGTERQRKDWLANVCISNEQSVLSILELPSTDRMGLSLCCFVTHVSLTTGTVEGDW